MDRFSASETKDSCTQNGASAVHLTYGGDSPASDCDPLPKVCPPSSEDKGSSSSDRKVAVFRLGQSLRTEPSTHVSRATAQQYVRDEVARWTNRGKAIQFTRNRTFARHGASAVMSAQMSAAIVEQALAGQRTGETLLTVAWKPRTKGTTDGEAELHSAQGTPRATAA